VSVLQRKELEDSPLADLHAIASELGIEGYRALRREDLVAAILDVQGGGHGAEAEPNGEQHDGEIDDRAAVDADEGEVDDEPAPEEAEGSVDDEPEAEHETRGGVLDVLPNGSGFLRAEEGDAVYVSPAQIKRCELRAGDEVVGPVRPARRKERHPSLVRVSTVNGRDAEPPEQRPHFDELTAVHASERLPAPGALDLLPFGKGSRVVVSGPAGAGATRLLRELAATLRDKAGDLPLTVVLAGVRPEEIADWREALADVPIVGGSFDRSGDELARALELAVERAKRVAERGGDAVVVVDSLAGVGAELARRALRSARKLEQGGSLTVIAGAGDGGEHLRVASTRIVLAGGGDEPRVVAERSGTQRADLLR
jgi:transcription termination factor Rho